VGVLVLGAALGAPAACNRAHLTASYGRANHQAFARQVANPGAATTPASERMTNGLDSQEAAIVSATYRRNLAPRTEESTTRGQMLYYAPPAPGGARSERGDLPPPSVPAEQR